jgi:hypothetical protein
MIVIEGPLSYFSTFAYTGEFMIRFGYISRLFHWAGGAYFTRSNYFYLPSLCSEEEGGGGLSTL